MDMEQEVKITCVSQNLALFIVSSVAALPPSTFGQVQG
jgi:hypothetical protein